MNRLVARCRLFLCELGFHSLRKLAVAIGGGSVVLVGIAMLVLPGPAFLVIPLGLAILTSEFLWARRWLKRARAMLPNGDKPPANPVRRLPNLARRRPHQAALRQTRFGGRVDNCLGKRSAIVILSLAGFDPIGISGLSVILAVNGPRGPFSVKSNSVARLP